MRRGRRPRGDVVGRAAEWTANHLGSARFLLWMTVFINVWFGVNAIRTFDYNFFVLNLLFSTMASYAAPLILLAQNRSADRDQLGLAADRANSRTARAEMAYLTDQITRVRSALADLPRRDEVHDDLRDLRAEFARVVQARRRR